MTHSSLPECLLLHRAPLHQFIAGTSVVQTMGGFLLVSAWIMYTFAEQEAFQRVQQVNDAEYDPMLHRGTDSSQGYQQDDPSEVVTPFTSSLGTPNGHSAYEAHGTAVHRIVASSVSSSTL